MRSSTPPVKQTTNQRYQPNEVPRAERVFNVVLGLFLLTYGTAGLLNHSLKFSSRGRVLLWLKNGPAWLMALAFILGSLVLLSVVLDHYDRRNNEHHYRTFRHMATRLGWCAAAAALVSHLYLGFTR
jgi:hypothetical protein